MINVTKFLVSNDLKSIELDFTVTVGQTATQLLLWDEITYKDPERSIDLTSLLSGASNTESIVITAESAGVTSFDGLYFAQITTSEPAAAVIATANFTQYYITQAKLIANIDLSCLNCNTNFQNALLFDLYLEATKNALLVGRFRDAIENLEKLVIVVEDSDCSGCNDIEPVISSAGNVVSVGVIDCLLTEV